MFSKEPSASVLRGAAVATLVSAFALWPIWRAFIAHPDSIHTTPFGDQAFFLWAIERARNAHDVASFSIDCDLSTSECFDLSSVPQEWPSFYVHGRLAHFIGLRANVLMSLLYYSSPW